MTFCLAGLQIASREAEMGRYPMFDRILANASLLEKGLDAAWRKNDVIANNIANVDTPGFKSSSVDFESVFREALDSGGMSTAPTATSAFEGLSGRRSLQGASQTTDQGSLVPSVRVNNQTSIRMDGNNVDIDAEMTELAKNAILYDTLSYAATRELGRLKMVINEGK